MSRRITPEQVRDAARLAQEIADRLTALHEIGDGVALFDATVEFAGGRIVFDHVERRWITENL